MGLFNFKKNKTTACDCGCACGSAPQKEEVATAPVEEELVQCDCGGMCPASEVEAKKAAIAPAQDAKTGVKVLGSGCKKCMDLETATKEALQSLGMADEVEHITDFGEIASYGVMNTPALVVDGNVVSVGKVLKSKEVETILQKTRG